MRGTRVRGATAIAAVVSVALSGCSFLPIRDTPAYSPERLAPPAPSRSWEPAQAQNPPAPKLEEKVEPEPDRTYNLPGLIDIALRANPSTRISWQQARAAAARVGLADSRYFPVVAMSVQGGTTRVEDLTNLGPASIRGPSLTPLMTLQWDLIDFGRRDADFDTAMQQLLQMNFRFNRNLQKVGYEVQQAFYQYDASRAQVAAAEATLKSATSVQQAADARLDQGLATKTEALLARQETARAAYEVQAAQRGVAHSQAFLADAIGLSPAQRFRVVELDELELPKGLANSVDEVMNQALEVRPDLAARLAELRSREAEVRRANASFKPKIGFTGDAGGTGGRYFADVSQKSFDYQAPVYSALVEFSWTLFDGYARENSVRLAEARRAEAQAELTQSQLAALREVWKSYADVKVALLQVEYARALLAASEDAYEAALESYTAGLADIVELLTAERDLARARSTLIDSKAELLRSSAALAFAVGAGAP